METLKMIEARRVNSNLLDKGEITFDEYTKRQNELDSEELDDLFKMASRECLTDLYYLGLQTGLWYAIQVSFLVNLKEFDSLPLEAKIAVHDFKKKLSDVITDLRSSISIANGREKEIVDQVPF